MRVYCLIIVILGLALNSVCAQIVPYRGDLSSQENELYQQIEQKLIADGRAAIAPCVSLIKVIDKSDNQKLVWSTLNYTALLVENDSVFKARSILLDSSELKLTSQEPWVQNLHSVNLASVLELSGEYANAENLLRAVLEDQTRSELQLLAMMKLAENLRFQGKLDLSRIKWYESIKLSEQFADSSYIAESHMGRGIVFFLLERLVDAEADIQIYQDFAVRTKNRKKEAYAISLLGLIDYKNREYEKAIEKSLQSYELRQSVQDFKGQGESLNNLALGYMGLKNWAQALRYLQEAVQLKTLASDLSQMTVILNNMGHCYKQLGNDSEAERYFKLALTKGWNNGQMGDVVNSYNNLIKLNIASQRFEEAVKYQSRLLTVKDSLSQIERAKAIDALEVQFETDKKQQEIVLLQQQQTIITNRWLTLALGLFLTIVIGALIFDNQRRKHRQETELLTAEDELQKAELKIMSDLLDHNQQKLSLYTENLLRKNELVGQLETKLKSAVENVGELEAEQSELLVNFSGVRILTDDDWEEFKTLFDGVHRGMLDRLLSKYENLTLAEQRLFLLMKLDMSTKEIANILGVSPDSVKKGRYRLKKKIDISDDMSLQDFVSGF